MNEQVTETAESSSLESLSSEPSSGSFSPQLDEEARRRVVTAAFGARVYELAFRPSIDGESRESVRSKGEDAEAQTTDPAGVDVIEGNDDSAEGAASDAQSVDAEPQRLEDAHIGARIAEDHLAGQFVHAKAFGWMRFDGRRWLQVEEAIVANVVRLALIELHRSEARDGADVSRLQQLSRMLSASRIRSILWVARLLVTTEEQFDAHPDLLNVHNGVVDLRDGSLRAHDPSLMLTKVANVDYRPDAVHADWEQALKALPEDAADWLQIRMGQGLTGHAVSDDRLVILKGSGSNGKTTIIDAVRTAVGSNYAVTLPDRVLLARPGDHPTEMMVLRGARLALLEELPELGHLNVKRLKDLHGTGEMTARLIAKDSVSWTPSHTIFVTTNYLPRVDESDHGTWRRLALVDFPFRYRAPGDPSPRGAHDRDGDTNLRERIRMGDDGQHEAVLAWLVNGARRWYQDDRSMGELPPSVRASNETWRASSDLLMRYIADRLVFDPGSWVVSTALYEDFKKWVQDNGHVAWSDQSFTSRFAQHSDAVVHGVEKKRGIRVSRPGLSHRPGVIQGPLPGSCTAWTGLRFRLPKDDVEDRGEEV